jgi:hypothetical protein
VRRLALTLGMTLLATAVASAQIKKMVRDDAPAEALSAAERSQLGDPMFVLALRSHPNEGDVQKIVDLVKGASAQVHFFVVDELIADPAPAGSRRAVLAFRGVNQTLKLDPNVMLSVILTPTGITPNFIEAWGWDARRGRFNFYRFEQASNEQAPGWKFRGSSAGADRQTPTQRRGTCLACHVNGEPLMKELTLPWNNWHSTSFAATYLRPSGATPWPVVADLALLTRLENARVLQTDFIQLAIARFNRSRADALLKRNAQGSPTVVNGMQEVIDGRRLLRPLFETTQYNVASSGTLSGLHPFPAASGGPVGPIAVPATFFLNANLLAGGGATQYQGLDIAEALSFNTLAQISADEYRTLVNDDGTTIGGRSGDANFAWFVPAASHVDNHMIDLLVQRGVITKEFAGAAMAVDHETPVFSTKTPGLLRFIPQTFRFKPLAVGAAPAAHPDRLTQAVIAALQAASPAAGTPEADFLTLLQNPNPLSALKQRVLSYRQRVQTRLDNATTRAAELRRLFHIAVDRRRAALNHPVLGALTESDALFPVPQQ